MYNFDEFHIDPLKIKDAESLSRLMLSNKESFKKYLPVTLSQNKSLAASEAYIIRKDKENEKKTALTLAIKENGTHEVAGLIILKNIDQTKKQGEFAYCVGEKYSGRGWMTTTVRQMSMHVHESHGITTLQIITHKSNIGSCKVAEKSGYVWKKTRKNEFTPPNGKPLDMELYELYL